MLCIIKVLLRDKSGVYMFGWLKKWKEYIEHSMRGGEHYATLHEPATGYTSSSRRNSARSTTTRSDVNDRQAEEFEEALIGGVGSRGDVNNGIIPVGILVDALETVRAEATEVQIQSDDKTFYIPREVKRETRNAFLEKLGTVIGAKIEVKADDDGRESLHIKNSRDFPISFKRNPHTKELGFEISGITKQDLNKDYLSIAMGEDDKKHSYIGANNLLWSLKGIVSRVREERISEIAEVTGRSPQNIIDEKIHEKHIKQFFNYIERAQGKEKMAPIKILDDDYSDNKVYEMRIPKFKITREDFDKLNEAFGFKGYRLGLDKSKNEFVISVQSESEYQYQLDAFSKIDRLIPERVRIDNSAGHAIARSIMAPELART